MNAWCAWTTGFGIGLASVGGLWLTIRYAIAGSHGLAALAVSQLLRFSLAAAGFYAVACESPGLVMPALAGFWLARRIVIGRWGGLKHVGL